MNEKDEEKRERERERERGIKIKRGESKKGCREWNPKVGGLQAIGQSFVDIFEVQ